MRDYYSRIKLVMVRSLLSIYSRQSVTEGDGNTVRREGTCPSTLVQATTFLLIRRGRRDFKEDGNDTIGYHLCLFHPKRLYTAVRTLNIRGVHGVVNICFWGKGFFFERGMLDILTLLKQFVTMQFSHMLELMLLYLIEMLMTETE